MRAALPALLLGVSLGTWVAGLVLAWPTYLGMNTATGIVAALAEASLEGRSPGGEEGEALLATYYFPPFPLAVAAARRTGLGVLDALRAASAAAGVLLLLAVARAGHVLAGGWRGAFVAVAILGTTFLFRSAVFAGYTDLLPVACSLAGLAAWERDRDLRGWLVPALAGLAILGKLTALTLPVAVVFCGLRDRNLTGLGRFALRYALVIAAGVAITAPVHGPAWYLDTVRTTLLAPPFTFNAVRGPAEVLRYLGTYPELAVCVALTLVLLLQPGMRAMPLAAFAAISAIRATAALANMGSGHNHLLELGGAVAIGAAMCWVQEPLPSARWTTAALAIVVVAASWRETVPIMRHAGRPESRRAEVIEGMRGAGPRLFTEDPMIALALGHRPAIADPTTLRSLDLRGDPRARRVIARLQAAEYDPVVLDNDIVAFSTWYRDGFLGASAVEAIRTRYFKAGVVAGANVYLPIRPPER